MFKNTETTQPDLIFDRGLPFSLQRTKRSSAAMVETDVSGLVKSRHSLFRIVFPSSGLKKAKNYTVFNNKKIVNCRRNLFVKSVNPFLPSFEINSSQRWQDMISEVTSKKPMRFSQAHQNFESRSCTVAKFAAVSIGLPKQLRYLKNIFKLKSSYENRCFYGLNIITMKPTKLTLSKMLLT